MAFDAEGAVVRAPQEPVVAVERPATALTVVLTSLDEAKAEDVVTIDITGKTTIGDHRSWPPGARTATSAPSPSTSSRI